LGVTFHELASLRYLAARAPLGDVLTVGRHWLLVKPETAAALAGLNSQPGSYCEPAIMALGARSVKSIDASPYEYADYVADLGIVQNPPAQFDLVADFGSLEHVFNAATALGNVAGLCRDGGRIVHVLPANNLAGHGFWQFSSDIFFEFYAPENGFAETQVFYASSLDESVWYRARRAQPGERFEFVSVEPIVVICFTRKLSSEKQKTGISQPFYSVAWEANSSADLARTIQSDQRRHALLKKLLGRTPSAYRWLRNLHLALGLATGRSPYSLANAFEPVPLRSLLGIT